MIESDQWTIKKPPEIREVLYPGPGSNRHDREIIGV